MSEKADITFRKSTEGKVEAHPSRFVLEKGARQLRIANETGGHLRLNLRDVPVDTDEEDVASGAVVTIPVRLDASVGTYDYRVEEPVRRQSPTESSPKIIVEGSPKIIVESSPVADA